MSDLAELLKLTKTFLDRGDSVEEMAGKLNLDVQLTWFIALEGLDVKVAAAALVINLPATLPQLLSP